VDFSDGDDDDETLCALSLSLSLSLSLVCEEKKRRGNRHRALSLPFSSPLTLAERARSFCQQTTAATNNTLFARSFLGLIVVKKKKSVPCCEKSTFFHFSFFWLNGPKAPLSTSRPPHLKEQKEYK